MNVSVKPRSFLSSSPFHNVSVGSTLIRDALFQRARSRTRARRTAVTHRCNLCRWGGSPSPRREASWNVYRCPLAGISQRGANQGLEFYFERRLPSPTPPEIRFVHCLAHSEFIVACVYVCVCVCVCVCWSFLAGGSRWRVGLVGRGWLVAPFRTRDTFLVLSIITEIRNGVVNVSTFNISRLEWTK